MKRCRACRSSAMRASGVSVAVGIIARRADSFFDALAAGCLGGTPRLLLVQVAEDLLDAVLVLDRLVELEVQLRNAAQLQPAALIHAVRLADRDRSDDRAVPDLGRRGWGRTD